MAVLSDEERRRAWARFMRLAAWRAFPPTINKVDFRAAVNAADDWIDANAVSFNQALPQPYRAQADANQKALLIAGLAMRRAGRFDTEEDQ